MARSSSNMQLGERLGQLGLADAGRAEEQERADRPVRVRRARRASAGSRSATAPMASSWPITRSCRRSSSMHELLQLALHAAACTGMPVQLADDLGDVLGVDLLLQHRRRSRCSSLERLAPRPSSSLLERRQRRRSAARRRAAGRRRARRRSASARVSSIGCLRRWIALDAALLGLPVRAQARRSPRAASRARRSSASRRSRGRRRVSLASAASSISSRTMRRSTHVELVRHRVDLDAQAAGGLVDQVDRLVGQEAVGDVAVARASAAATSAASWMRTPWCTS